MATADEVRHMSSSPALTADHLHCTTCSGTQASNIPLWWMHLEPSGDKVLKGCTLAMHKKGGVLETWLVYAVVSPAVAAPVSFLQACSVRLSPQHSVAGLLGTLCQLSTLRLLRQGGMVMCLQADCREGRCSSSGTCHPTEGSSFL